MKTTSLLLNDTIAAIATGPAAGAIGIIRISGADLDTLLNKILKGGFPQTVEPGRVF